MQTYCRGCEVTIEELAKTRKYDKIEQGYSWNGYWVFHVWRSSEEGARLGPPQYILQNGNVVRFADLTELGTIRKEQRLKRKSRASEMREK